MQEYITITDKTIFKKRYQDWYFITQTQKTSERFFVAADTVDLLLSLFKGKSISQVAKEFNLSLLELLKFLDQLQEPGLISYINQPIDSSSQCFSVQPPLDSVNLLLTNACNLHCQHCYVQSGKKLSAELTGQQWIDVLQQAQKMGVFAINVSGGEPLLHPDFQKIAEYIASVPIFQANLNTNATLITKTDLALLARAFSSVQISIDHVLPQHHDRIRGVKGSFNKTLQAIKLLVAKNIPVTVAFTLMPDNLNSLELLVDFCHKFKVSTLNIGLVADIGRAKSNQLLTTDKHYEKELGEFVNTMYDKLQKLSLTDKDLRILLPFRINSQPTARQVKKYICSGDQMQIVYIMADGSVMPCDKLPMNKFSYGNIKDQSLQAIWLSQSMKNFKLMSPQDLPKCKTCQNLLICGGACVARAYQQGGSLLATDCLSCLVAEKFAQNNL